MHSKLIAGESRSGYSASYTYDANGNRASRTVNGVTETYTVDSGDKLTQVSVSGVATKTFDYDGAGRTTSIQTSAGTTSFTYDFESRVTGITYPNASTNSFTYNGLDTRVGKTDSAGTATFRRMGAGVTAPVLGDGSASFTPGISERRGSTSLFYGADYLGTNSSLYSSSETVSATRQYDAFGNLTSSSGSSANPFGFAGNWGYQNDSDSGLMLLGHRYYDASTGRFLTRDPIKDGRNWFAYCGNDPIGAVDPEGTITKWIHKFLNGAGNWTNYHVVPGGPKQAKKYAKKLDPTGTIRSDPGHYGGPTHKHNENLDEIHVTSEEEADLATGSEWNGWRKRARMIPLVGPALVYIKEIVEAVDPSPVGTGMLLADGLIAVVDPIKNTAVSRREAAFHRWTDGIFE